MKHLVSFAVFALLIACENTGGIASPPQPALPSIDADTCGANQYAALIGQDGTALERVLILGQVRVIRPGTSVTMDFRPERLNFNIGATGRIERIFCG